MAAVSAMQVLLPGSGAPGRLSSRGSVRLMFSARGPVLSPGRVAGLRLRCMAEDADDQERPVSAASEPNLSPPVESNPPRPKPKVSTKFSDLFAFSGPAPERINGRLAMIGFMAAMAVELSKGQDLFDQISQGGVPWFIGTSLVLSVASLVPLFKGVRAEAETEGIMNANAELWNGRFAMLGLVALAFTEYVKGSSLV